MTLWHVQKLYMEDGSKFVVLPYEFGQNLKIENSYKATIKFCGAADYQKLLLINSAKKKNKKLRAGYGR